MNLQEWLSTHKASLSLRINQYDYERSNRLIGSWETDQLNGKVETPEATFEVKSALTPGADYYDCSVSFTCTAGELSQMSVSADIDLANWSRENYVLMPGVVYDGNRPFRVFRSPNWFPFITDPRYVGPEVAPFVTDIPKLRPARIETGNDHVVTDIPLSGYDGVARLQMRSGHMATPAVGFQSPSMEKGFWLLTEQASAYGDYGLDIEEFRSGDKARITLTAPVMRETSQYYFFNNLADSKDHGITLKAGEEITLRFRLYFFETPRIQGLFDKYTAIRKALPADRELSFSYPFSNTFEIVEQKFNNDQWVEEPGYYKFRLGFYYDFQVGWMGGGVFTYPLLLHGDQKSKDRVLKMMDWFFGDYISPSGYFWDSSVGGTEFGGIYPGIPVADSVTLTRCNGDGLYYSMKHFETMQHLDIEVKPKWEAGAKGVADAFLSTWEKFGQLGQYIDLYSGDVVVGNSASGAIVPAGLVLASRYYEDKHYLEKAEEMGEHFYQNYTKRGISYGGPGDALNNPDCESSYALVESFTLLYEATQKEKWLRYAEEAAKQFSTWVLSYNFKFPPESTYGKLNKKPMGAVFANPQNNHAAPGICTYSGISLLNLSRYTGNPFYAELLRDIAHNMPQYLSHPDEMINPDHVGWMSERVNTSDWKEGIGEISYHSTWPEVCLALVYTEIPGVYINASEGQLIAYDNIKARLLEGKKNKLTLELENPTNQPAVVKVLVEAQEDLSQSVDAFRNYTAVALAPKEQKIITLNE